MKIKKIILILLFVLAASFITSQSSIFFQSLAYAHSEAKTEFTFTDSQPDTSVDRLLPLTPIPDTSTPATKSTHPASNLRAAQSGPEQFLGGVNPLTGLPVNEPALLNLPPALISVSNFPVSARPQAGLSFSPYVYELYIGEGMTRFLAIFYGEYPQVSPQNNTVSTVATNNQAEIGPVRSGRLPYQAIRQLYNGFLVMASASAEVRNATGNSTNIYGSDSDDINSALIDVEDLQALAEEHEKVREADLTGNTYDPSPPEGGRMAEKLWVFYNFYNQVEWIFDQSSGSYLRYQDKADGSGKFYPATDRLTGEQLAFDNVIVLYVKHEVLNSAKTLIDFDLLYTQGYAYLFRDGKVYPIFWSTIGAEYEKTTGRLRPIRFTDRNGNPIPLKPGNTWVEVVDMTTTLSESKSGNWKARFYAP